MLYIRSWVMASGNDIDIKPFTIGILGIGGVGGYFGGLLSRKYAKSNNVNIVFLAKPNTAEIIKKSGLKVITDTDEFVTEPDDVVSNPEQSPQLDVLICCTKSYDTETALRYFKQCISPDTIILPLMNGVDSRDRIRFICPGCEVLDGCVYLVSEVLSPGIIRQKGEVHSLYFGHGVHHEKKLKLLENTMQNAGIDAHYSPIIDQIVWEKFIFISSVASATTFMDKTIGEIRDNPGDFEILMQLLDEAISVAISAGAKIPLDIAEKTVKKIAELPADASSSMHKDYQNNRPTEYKSLTEYIVVLGESFQADTPTFKTILNWFRERENQNAASS